MAIGEGMYGVPDVIVMLHASPAELFARIRARQRPGEESYKPSDIVRLTERYEARLSLGTDVLGSTSTQAR